MVNCKKDTQLSAVDFPGKNILKKISTITIIERFLVQGLYVHKPFAMAFGFLKTLVGPGEKTFSSVHFHGGEG